MSGGGCGMEMRFVVPCRNEEANIGRCLDSILAQPPAGDRHEVVVVDNGSTDATPAVLRSYRGRVAVLSLPGAHISAVRNHGAEGSTLRWLAFIDADVELGAGWAEALREAVAQWQGGGGAPDAVVIGATYGITENPTWVEEVWYEHLRRRRGHGYINGGNLVVPRTLFERIGGFAAGRVTGEDVAFCREARAAGATILHWEALRTVHHGYPRTLRDFYRREKWHGSGMSLSWRSPGKDLLLGCFFPGVSVAGLALALWSGRVAAPLAGAGLAMLTPVAAMAFSRVGPAPGKTARLTLLYFLYGWAKAHALLGRCLRGLARA